MYLFCDIVVYLFDLVGCDVPMAVNISELSSPLYHDVRCVMLCDVRCVMLCDVRCVVLCVVRCVMLCVVRCVVLCVGCVVLGVLC